MRIGTWNLEGKWSSQHQQVLAGLACDVWLLTENRLEARPDGYFQHLSSARMAESKHWAGILSRWPILALPDPHPAAVAGEIQGLRFVCSVLPWTASGAREPFDGCDHPDRVAVALSAISPVLDAGNAVWGGDWNQPLTGNISGFSRRAQAHLLAALKHAGLQVATRELAARNGTQASIDHIAVPSHWTVNDARRESVPGRLSDHDVYWVDVARP